MDVGKWKRRLERGRERRRRVGIEGRNGRGEGKYRNERGGERGIEGRVREIALGQGE